MSHSKIQSYEDSHTDTYIHTELLKHMGTLMIHMKKPMMMPSRTAAEITTDTRTSSLLAGSHCFIESDESVIMYSVFISGCKGFYYLHHHTVGLRRWNLRDIENRTMKFFLLPYRKLFWRSCKMKTEVYSFCTSHRLELVAKCAECRGAECDTFIFTFSQNKKSQK